MPNCLLFYTELDVVEENLSFLKIFLIASYQSSSAELWLRILWCAIYYSSLSFFFLYFLFKNFKYFEWVLVLFKWLAFNKKKKIFEKWLLKAINLPKLLIAVCWWHLILFFFFLYLSRRNFIHYNNATTIDNLHMKEFQSALYHLISHSQTMNSHSD